ncbi:DUF4190 domain-containing protein [Streptomyces diastatochromogenes]|nr:DUF4190 domain-containing protein [Streptomyces diastatochromogenes]
MSDEAPQPTPREHSAGSGPESPRVSLDKGSAADPWAASPAPEQGAGDTVLSGAPGTPVPPPHPSVHDQQTVTSLPTPDAPADAVPPAWARPADPYAPPASAPANPFAPPTAPPAATPYAPPVAPANPYGPPMAQPYETAPVPPPPISPDGPGQVPYGYPPQQPGYGAPGIPSYPAAGGYGWPGLQPQPNNGMGTASLVLGILATVGFCAWPLALVMGVVAVILGALGRGKARRGEATNPGVALAGIICGAASIVLILGLFAFVIAAYKS